MLGWQQYVPNLRIWHSAVLLPCSLGAMASRRRASRLVYWPSHQQASAAHSLSTTTRPQYWPVPYRDQDDAENSAASHARRMLRRVLQSMCEPIEVLIALTLAVLDLPLQCSHQSIKPTSNTERAGAASSAAAVGVGAR